MHLSDGRDQSARINDAQAIQTSSVFLCLINVGPPSLSCHLAICSPPDRAMRLAPFSPFLILRHLSISPLLVRVVPFPSHHPLTTCHVSRSLPRQPPTKACPLYLISCPPPLISFRHVSSPVTSLTPHHFISHPHSFGATTPVMHPILRAGLHAYSSGRSANPGGSAKGLPRRKGAELARPSSIPMKQLLK
jgi:hypothetical protein